MQNFRPKLFQQQASEMSPKNSDGCYGRRRIRTPQVSVACVLFYFAIKSRLSASASLGAAASDGYIAKLSLHKSCEKKELHACRGV
jgi:hypothetical protein